MPFIDYRQRAEHWREHARQLRDAANNMSAAERERFLEVADEWTAMADQADRLFKVSQTVGPTLA